MRKAHIAQYGKVGSVCVCVWGGVGGWVYVCGGEGWVGICVTGDCWCLFCSFERNRELKATSGVTSHRAICMDETDFSKTFNMTFLF